MRVGGLDNVAMDNISDNKDLENLKNIVPNEKSKISKEKLALKDKAADDVAKQFETMFVDMMMKGMRETAKPAEESNAQSIYKSMLDNEYTKSMTDAQSFGIREMVKDWITKNG